MGLEFVQHISVGTGLQLDAPSHPGAHRGGTVTTMARSASGMLNARGELTPKRELLLYEHQPAQDLLNNSWCVLLAYPSEK